MLLRITTPGNTAIIVENVAYCKVDGIKNGRMSGQATDAQVAFKVLTADDADPLRLHLAD